MSYPKEKVDKWMELATDVLFPSWLQAHSNSYLDKMLNKSREHIRLLKYERKVMILVSNKDLSMRIITQEQQK